MSQKIDFHCELMGLVILNRNHAIVQGIRLELVRITIVKPNSIQIKRGLSPLFI